MKYAITLFFALFITNIAYAGGLSCKYKNIGFVGGPDLLNVVFPAGPVTKPIFNSIQLDVFQDYNEDGTIKYKSVIFDLDKKSNLPHGKSMPFATYVAKSMDAQVIIISITGEESQKEDLGNFAGDYEGVMTHINGTTTHVFEVTCNGLE